jgi:DHA3 family macrolide efflux protein-like MFS transporter
MSVSPTISKNWLRTFIIIWIGQAFSLFGSMLVQFALVWWLTQKTGSATILATASLVAYLPMVFLGPFAGAIVDRVNRKTVMILADALIALTTLALVFIAAYGQLAPWHIYIAMFIRSLGQAFHFPAMQASTSLLVPEKHLSRVAGINQALNGAMNIIAPPSGAVLIGVLQLHWVLSIDILTAILAILPLLIVHIPQPVQVLTTVGKPIVGSILMDIKEGFLYVYRWKGLFYVLLFAVLINFLISPAFTLLPLLVTKHFHGTAIHYGWMESAIGIGIVIGGLGLGAWGGFKKKIVTSSLGIAGMGLGALITGFTPGNMYWMGLVGIFVLGLMNPIANGPFFALIQSKVDPGVQGRVMTMTSSITSGLTPLALIIAGPLADRFGIQTWFVLGGIFCLIISILMGAIKVIFTLEDQSGDLITNPIPDHQLESA